jgi:DNA mismatch repair ATPase MutS
MNACTPMEWDDHHTYNDQQHQKTKKDSGGEEMLNFPYKIRRGLNPDSSGIDIARMVGLPKEVISDANTIKRQLGDRNFKFN